MPKHNSTADADISRTFIENHDSPFVWQRAAARKNLYLAKVAYNLAFVFLSRPLPLRLTRALFSLFRKISPIQNIGNFTVLTRHDDVLEVLSRMEGFSSSDAMNNKTPAGPFVLSIDWRIQHDRELEILKKASFPFVDRDAKRISLLASTKAGELINQSFSMGQTEDQRLNIAEGYTENIALHIVENFIGIKALDGQKSREDLRRWLRILAAQIFTPPPTGSDIQAQTAEASSSLICYVHAVIKTLDRKGRPLICDSLLQRLVKIVEKEKRRYSWLNDDWICALVSGMMVAGNATVARAQTQAIYRMLTLPGAQPLVVKAAKNYNSDNNSETRAALLQLVFEALRFNPMLPVLSPRYCIRDTVIAPNTPRANKTAAGANVLPFVFAAMFDPIKFPNPNRFEAGRPLHNYLHFGWGPHICFGKFVAEIQFVETIAALFGNDRFDVKPVRFAKIQYRGPAAVDYQVDLAKSGSSR